MQHSSQLVEIHACSRTCLEFKMGGRYNYCSRWKWQMCTVVPAMYMIGLKCLCEYYCLNIDHTRFPSVLWCASWSIIFRVSVQVLGKWQGNLMYRRDVLQSSTSNGIGSYFIWPLLFVTASVSVYCQSGSMHFRSLYCPWYF